MSDMSYEGCRLVGAQSLEPAERIKLVVPGNGAVDAQVRWKSGEATGVLFSPAAPSPSWLRQSGSADLNRPFHFGSGRTFGRKTVSGPR